MTSLEPDLWIADHKRRFPQFSEKWCSHLIGKIGTPRAEHALNIRMDAPDDADQDRLLGLCAQSRRANEPNPMAINPIFPKNWDTGLRNPRCFKGMLRVNKGEQRLGSGIFWAAALALFGASPHFGGGEKAALIGMQQRFLVDLIQVSGALQDKCDVMRERNCIIVFENHLEIAVPHFEMASPIMREALRHTNPVRGGVRPVARFQPATDIQNISVGTKDP